MGSADSYFKPEQRETLLERISIHLHRGDEITEAGDANARLWKSISTRIVDRHRCHLWRVYRSYKACKARFSRI